MINETPVLVLNCGRGGLAIFRSLGALGVECWGVDDDPRCAGFLSRYSRGRRFIATYDAEQQEEYLESVLEVGRKIGRRALLIPTSDELIPFAARYQDRLEEYFIYPRKLPDLVVRLVSKVEMSRLAKEFGIPVPQTYLPEDEEDLLQAIERFQFPVMLKPCHGGMSEEQLMVIVEDLEQLIEEYHKRENPEAPNMMIQEYLPGEDDQVYIFNGYFDRQSRCLAGFTGRKIRQHPIHRGCAAMGEQLSNQPVAEHMTRFLEGVGYQGVVDAGLRFDARDGKYKLLDVNPRVGQAFRLFLSKDGTDVVRAMYLDLTGQRVGELVPREGRRWAIEDFELSSLIDYWREGAWPLGKWLASYRSVEELAWWSLRDPWPFAVMVGRLLPRASHYLLARVGLRTRRLFGRATSGRTA